MGQSKTFSEKMVSALSGSEKDSMLSQIRQRMHDKIPEKAKGHVGQKVIDALTDVIITKSMVAGPHEQKFYIRFVFVDPDGNDWHMDREFTHHRPHTEEELDNAEAYMWEKAMTLTEDDFVQLAFVIT